MKKIIASLMVAISLISLFAFALNVLPTKAWTGDQIIINPDGTIDPEGAPIQRSGNVYTLSEDIDVGYNDGIIIEIGDVVLDGVGHMLHGEQSENRGVIIGNNSITVKDLVIDGFYDSIELGDWSSSIVFNNTVLNNSEWGVRLSGSGCRVIGNSLKGSAGVWLGGANDNCVLENTFEPQIAESSWLGFYSSSGNHIYHNSFLKSGVVGPVDNSSNIWDDGYPSGGNYWSDYTGIDAYHGPAQDLPGPDGIGDTPYFIGGLDVYQDHYPFMVANQRITVNNTVEGVTPPDPWNYTISDVGNEYLVADFTLPAAGGGSISFERPQLAGSNYLIAQHHKFDYETSIIVNGTVVSAITENLMDMTLVSLGPNDAISVEFNNTEIPAGAWTSGSEFPPVKMTYNIPSCLPIPVQVSWDADIQPDGRLDLVKGKPTTILVNLTDVLAPTGPIALSDSVTISVTSTSGFFNFPPKTTTGQGIKDNGIIFFTANPPSSLGDDTITSTITYGPTQSTLGPYTTIVSVKDTCELSLYYSYLYRKDSSGNLIDYGTEPAADYGTMLANTRDFINAVYPVPKLTVDSNPQGSEGNVTQPNYLGILKDCQYVAQQAKLRFPNSPNAIGVAIGPNSTFGQKYQNYFAYHGAVTKGRTAVGVSFGPGTKGVVVMDGYYSAAAHEVAHTFGLYYGVPEQYLTYNPGMPSTGFYSAQNQWRAGYDFMGLSPYKLTTNVWTNTTSTFEPLFRSLKTPNDPQILLVNGIIYKDGSVELPFTWYRMAVGTPDTIPEGDFAIRFIAPDGVTVLGETSFDAKFYMNLDPGIGVGEDLPDVSGFGSIETDFAGFAFATAYPPGTATIELVDKRNPDNPLATISAADVVEIPNFGGFLPPINNDGTSVFKKETTIPVKFQLKSSQGNFITTATARLYVAKIDANGVPGTYRPGISASSAVVGNLFRYDLINNQYIFNLSAKSMSAGRWQIKVKFDDGTEKTVQITIK